MKKTILVILAAMLVLLTLAGCGKANSDTEQSAPASSTEASAQNSEKPASSDPAGASAGDFGWIRLDIPDGFIYVKEAEYYVTIQNETDSKQFVRIAYDYIMDRTLEQVVLTQISNNTEKYFKGADGAFSGFAAVMIALAAGYWLLVDKGSSLNAFLIAMSAGSLILGFLISFINIPATTMIMRVVDKDKLSKVMSIISVALQGLIPVASLLAGAVLQYMGSSVLLFVCAAGFTFTALAMLFNRKVRDI